MPSAYYLQLVEAWRNLSLKEKPYILAGDEALRLPYREKELIHGYSSYDNFIANENHGREPERGTRYHTGLLPIPYCGNLANAKVFILLGNPGFGYHDYYAESEVPDYRDALIRNLKQEVVEGGYPMLFLNPKYGWHGGGEYWRNKFADILRLSMKSYVQTLKTLSQGVAVLESIPYHSSKMGCPPQVLRELASVRLMKSYVQEDLLPRAKRGKITLLNLRGDWGPMEEQGNVIVYKGPERVAALLSKNSRGGKKIVEFLGIQLRADHAD